MARDPSTLDDEALALAAGRGDRRALEVLLDRHIDRVHAICRRVLGDPHDAQDATQEALVAIAKGVPTWDARARFTTWLHRVAMNAAIDEARRRGRRPVPAEPTPDTGPATADPAGAVAAQLDVDRALAHVPEDFRAALVLRDLSGLDYATIAEVLEIPPGTVRSRIARGRAALAAALGNPAGGAERPTGEDVAAGDGHEAPGTEGP